MRSSAAKLALGVAAWIAVGAAAVFVLQSERQVTARRSTVRAFDVVAREVVAALAGIKASQQGYVAPGQGLGLWVPRVDGLLTTATTGVDELRQIAATPDAHKALTEVTGTLSDLRAIDKRARQYVNADQSLMAADVVFSEGGETAALASRQVEAARHVEYLAFDAAEAAFRRQQALATAGATGFAALAIAALILLPPGRSTTPRPSALPVAPRALVPAERRYDRVDDDTREIPAPSPAPPREQEPAAAAPPQQSALPTPDPAAGEVGRDATPVLLAAAELCSELSRARDIDQISRLLERAADVLDASGLVVWVGTPGAATLRPVLAHGYSPQALARMPQLPRSGDNAAAAAFRTEKLQIVLTRPGLSGGALAVPMMSPEGCIGALTAEVKNGGESSDQVQAVASIFAAQLGGILAESVLQSQEFDEGVPTSRIASA